MRTSLTTGFPRCLHGFNIGSRLDSFPHKRLKGREEFRLRVGDYRVIYEFDVRANEIYLITLGHRREIYRREG